MGGWILRVRERERRNGRSLLRISGDICVDLSGSEEEMEVEGGEGEGGGDSLKDTGSYRTLLPQGGRGSRE